MLKQYFMIHFSNHTVKIIFNDGQELEDIVWTTNQYDSINFEHQAATLTGGRIELTPTVNMAQKISPSTQCVKVAGLRKSYPTDPNIDIEKWSQQKDNLYVGRMGRVFITDIYTKYRHVFNYSDSKWANPFKVSKAMSVKEYNALPEDLKRHLQFNLVNKKISLADSILYYRDYIITSGLVNNIGEISGKNLGCFCDQKGDCHAKVLVELFNQYKKN